MDVETHEIPVNEAKVLYEEYLAGCKKHPADEFYDNMRQILKHMRNGKAVIDVPKVIADAGLGDDSMPKLAIARADFDTIHCQFTRDRGEAEFWRENDWTARHRSAGFICIRELPQISDEKAAELGWQAHNWNDGLTTVTSARRRQTTVPRIPPEFRPAPKLENYHILWEVDEGAWIEPQQSKRASRDPMLLKRINERMFVVLAVWDLTDLEMTVIAGLLQN